MSLSQKQFNDAKEQNEFSAETFVKGDLIYGNCEAREKIEEMLTKAQIPQPYYIDMYNNISRVLWSVFNQAELSSYVSHHPSSALAFELHKFASRFEDKETHNEARYYAGSFSVMYGEINGTSTSPFISKRCKLGILWTISRGQTVHFAFGNDFNFEECFIKKIKRYTCSELRFVYRNWSYLLPLKKIKFYYENNNQKYIEGAAPWELKPNLVELYKKRIKTPNKYGIFFEEFKSSAAAALRSEGINISNPVISEIFDKIKHEPQKIEKLISVYKQLRESKLVTNNLILNAILNKGMTLELAKIQLIIEALTILEPLNIPLAPSVLQKIAADPAAAVSVATKMTKTFNILKENEVSIDSVMQDIIIININDDEIIHKLQNSFCLAKKEMSELKLSSEMISQPGFLCDWVQINELISQGSAEQKKAASTLKNSLIKTNGDLCHLTRMHPYLLKEKDKLSEIYEKLYQQFVGYKYHDIQIDTDIEYRFFLTYQKGETLLSMRNRIMTELSVIEDFKNSIDQGFDSWQGSVYISYNDQQKNDITLTLQRKSEEDDKSVKLRAKEALEELAQKKLIFEIDENVLDDNAVISEDIIYKLIIRAETPQREPKPSCIKMGKF